MLYQVEQQPGINLRLMDRNFVYDVVLCLGHI
jgi:hypothetical protein